MTRQSSLALRRRLAALAAEQAGYFTATQAREIGYSHQSQKYHADSGNWTRAGRGLYRLPEWPGGEWDDLVRWTLWSGGVAVVSHESALSVHGLGDFDPAETHMTVPPEFSQRPKPGLVLHHARLDKGDMATFSGFVATTPQRSLLDVAAEPGAAIELLAGAMRDAFDRGLLTPGMLRNRADDFGPQAALTIERALQETED